MKLNKNILLGIGVLGLGVLEVLKYQDQKRKIEKLNHNLDCLGNCHNSFVKFQSEVHEEIDERLDYLEEEVVSNYEHMESLLKY